MGCALLNLGFGASLGRILAFERSVFATSTRHATATTHPRKRTFVASSKRLDGDSVCAILSSVSAYGMMTQLMAMKRVTGDS